MLKRTGKLARSSIKSASNMSILQVIDLTGIRRWRRYAGFSTICKCAELQRSFTVHLPIRIRALLNVLYSRCEIGSYREWWRQHHRYCKHQWRDLHREIEQGRLIHLIFPICSISLVSNP